MKKVIKMISWITVVVTSISYSLMVAGITHGGFDTNRNGERFTQVEDEGRSQIHLSHSWDVASGGVFKTRSTLNSHKNILTCTCNTAHDVHISVFIRQATDRPSIVEAGVVKCAATNNTPRYNV